MKLFLSYKHRGQRAYLYMKKAFFPKTDFLSLLIFMKTISSNILCLPHFTKIYLKMASKEFWLKKLKENLILCNPYKKRGIVGC